MQRLRFEMLGLIEEPGEGVCLTERGPRGCPWAVSRHAAGAARRGDFIARASRDKRGRRLGHQRQSPF